MGTSVAVNTHSMQQRLRLLLAQVGTNGLQQQGMQQDTA
jgi:hypothetical protein